MKISIAMATYNGAKYIKEQLESFVKQTKLPDELVITDDCSNDKTIDIVKEFANSAPFKVYLFKNDKKLGYTGNFNAALSRTNGDSVFLSDQDDVWFPEKIEFIYNLSINQPDKLALMNDVLLTDEFLNPTKLTKLGQINSAGLPMKSYVMGCASAVRRELLEMCLPIPEGFKGHDNWLIEFADRLGGKFVSEKVLQFYRRHGQNTSAFIANRTTKISRMSLLSDNIKYLFKNKMSKDEQYEAAIAQLNLYATSLVSLIDKAPIKYKQALIDFSNNIKSQISVIELRRNINKQNLFKRLVLIRKLYKQGGYNYTSGIKAILLDISGL